VIEKIIIIDMLANTCIESTGRFGMELGYHVTLGCDGGLQPRGDACGARDQWADESVMRRNPLWLPNPAPRPFRRAKIPIDTIKLHFLSVARRGLLSS
jgi:hypothetical protein